MFTSMKLRPLVPILGFFLLTACTDSRTPGAAESRRADPQEVARGAVLYQKNCATCHGANAEGTPEWYKAGADGRFPPPPLDGSGHAWHHPREALKKTIREGTAGLGGNMPAWRGKLSDRDIEAVILWFQSLWPAELYRNWSLMDDQARRAPT
ncbi:MAG: hypothetical protein A2151_06950 [Candidatus Muproteobacteria bacterium RBG_16_65_34]|uniref:Cytochrome c domain-containing protein n=1 Tax=Candidatus Muproteobacteria bacterium RBG_16_65_34 TaxID=1817760 RepID=A0A1F6TN70_9PROT|nr:MAG: hypothetical protein A2151_06950 [Candidatus Muproteobacteria bacterium RBG_16_65_34]